MRSLAAFKMLFHDRAAALGSIAGVIVIIFLVGQQLTTFFGLTAFMSRIVDISGADIWVFAQNTDNINATGSIPSAYQDRLAGLSGIKSIDPLIINAGTLKQSNGYNVGVQVVGLNPPRYTGAPNRWYAGRLENLYDPEGITLDNLDLPSLGNPKINDIFEINGVRVRLVALTEGVRGFGGSLVFTNIAKAREIGGVGLDRTTCLLVKVDDSIDKTKMKEMISRLLPRTAVYLTPEISKSTVFYYLKNSGIGTSFGFSTLIGILVGFVIIALTLYTNVLNKTRDYAMLKVLGARNRDIGWIVFLQAVYIAIIGIFAGFVLLAAFLTGTYDTALPSFMPWYISPILAISTFLICLVGSSIALRRAISVDPAGIFR